MEKISLTTENPDMPTKTHSITTKRMKSEKLELDSFKLPHQKLKQHIEVRFTALLKEYDSQVAQDETSIGTMPLTEMTIDTGNSEPVSKKPHLIAMKHYQWVKDKINKLLMAKVLWESWSGWSAPIIVVPKGDGGKCLDTDYHVLNKVTRKFIWPMPKNRGYFLPTERSKVLFCMRFTSRIPPHSIRWIVNS